MYMLFFPKKSAYASSGIISEKISQARNSHI